MHLKKNIYKAVLAFQSNPKFNEETPSFISSSPFLHQLTAAIVFLSFGIITTFLCLVIDGALIVLNMVSSWRLLVDTVKARRGHAGRCRMETEQMLKTQ